jgi:hypothetical protein
MEFVGDVGGEAALALEGGLEAVEGVIEAEADGLEFVGERIDGETTVKGGGVDGAGKTGNFIEGAEIPGDDPRNEGADREGEGDGPDAEGPGDGGQGAVEGLTFASDGEDKPGWRRPRGCGARFVFAVFVILGFGREGKEDGAAGAVIGEREIEELQKRGGRERELEVSGIAEGFGAFDGSAVGAPELEILGIAGGREFGEGVIGEVEFKGVVRAFTEEAAKGAGLGKEGFIEAAADIAAHVGVEEGACDAQEQEQDRNKGKGHSSSDGHGSSPERMA